jgi:hypothetical protein
MKLWWFLLLPAAALIGGCHRNPVTTSPPAASIPSGGLIPLSQLDVGASLLAEEENARFAISMRDAVAAANDVAQAVSFATQLSDHPSKLIPAEPSNGGRKRIAGPSDAASQHSPLTDFAALVDLTSAQSQLPAHLQAADTYLRTIQSRIPTGLVPKDLPLLRAAASLDLARVGAFQGRTPDLKTQLLTAQLALKSYVGPAHLAEARALAATIDKDLASPQALNAMLPHRLSSWLSQVVQWAGTDRWNTPLL